MLDTIPIRPTTEPLVVNAILLAKLLGKSVRTIRTLDAAGKLPVPLRIAGVVWRVSEINEWLAAGAPSRAVWVARTATRQK
jgi:predicted DNA-binding transcriptional regulator AlpA